MIGAVHALLILEVGALVALAVIAFGLELIMKQRQRRRP